MKKNTVKLLCTAAISAVLTVSAAAYADVPADHWAGAEIQKAEQAGFMSGIGDGKFGLGQPITRAQFASLLTRLMGWSNEAGSQTLFDDVPADRWYYSAVQTACKNGVMEAGGAFRPDEPITRQEMAVMLVRGLGYGSLAESLSSLALPFTDVTMDRGYVAMAYDFGIIAGKGDGQFDPAGSAKREEAAAMMVRLYEKYTAKMDWLHGFYAISSWAQRDLIAKMDGISFGWGRLEFVDGQPVVNTTAANGNSWRIPDSFTDATDFAAQTGVPANFAVTLTDPSVSRAVLLNEAMRKQAAQQIAELAQNYAGVTIDFEGMKGNALKIGLNSFLSDLRGMLKTEQKLYVCVHPVLNSSSAYYDAYDYRVIGEVADKVILMAHDYAATSMESAMMDAGFTTTPVTPFDEVYYALRCALDTETGVQDKSKLALAISTSSTAAWTLENGKVTNQIAIHPAMDTILKRLAQQDTQITYSDKYRNPYARYTDNDGKTIVLWYEDARSVRDKIHLARMFGVNGVSIWRIGAIPNESANNYNVWQTIIAEK